MADSTVVETPASTEKPPIPPRRPSAVKKEVKHPPKLDTSRDLKSKIAEKLDKDVVDSLVGGPAQAAPEEGGRRPRRHFVVKQENKKPRPADPTPAAVDAVLNAETAQKDSPKLAEKPAEKPAEKTVLPDEIRRSLKNYGHSDKDIDDELERDPEGFARHAKFVHATRQKEIEAYSRMGQGNLPAPVSQAVRQPVPQPKHETDLSEEEIASYEKLYPNDPTAKFIVRQARADLAFRTQQRNAQNASLEASTRQAVQNFFDSEPMKGYIEHYKDGAKRDKVLETAAAIINGGRLQGRNFNLTDALTMAHDALSTPVIKAAARKEILEEVQKRNDSVTVRNQAGNAAPAEEQDSGKTLAKKGKDGLSKDAIAKKYKDRIGKFSF